MLCCGSRDWNEPLPIYRRIALLPEDAEIIHGGAIGADTLAAVYAESIGLVVHPPFLPDYKRYGPKVAPIMRNRRMLDEEPALVIAWWDGSSTGTKDTIDEAGRRGIPVEVIEAAAP